MSRCLAAVTLAFILGFVSVPAGVASAARKYTITNLGPGSAEAINNSGQVTGHLALDGGSLHAFLYDGTIRDLGATGENSFGSDINNLGQITGYGTQGAFYYDGDMHWLTGDYAGAGISDGGLIAGYAAPGGQPHAMIYYGVWEAVPTLGGSEGACTAANNTGAVTGFSTTDNGERHAIVYDFTIHDIIPDCQHSVGYDINDAGSVAGYYYPDIMGYRRAFVHDGALHDLGVLPGYDASAALGINQAGHVVGVCATGGEQHAFLYDTEMRDLNDLIEPGSGWILTEAHDVNDGGAIVGKGIYNGVESGFILTPTPQLTIGPPSASSATSGPVTYVVTYEDAFTISLTEADVAVNATGTAAAGSVTVTGDSGSTRTVTLSGITGVGTLGISITAGTASRDYVTAAAAGPSTTFAVANMPAISISAPSASATRSGPITYTVTYTDASAVTLISSKVSLVKTGTASGSVSVTGTGNATREVRISSITGNGTLGISIAAGTAANAIGTAPAAGPSGTFAVYSSSPKATISAPSVTATKSGPVTYTVTYANAAAITLTPAKITLNRTSTANGVVSVSGEGTSSRTVTISDITGDGSLGITIASGTATNIVGSAAAAGPSAKVTVVNTRPKVTIGAPSAKSTKTGPVSYTVTYSGATAVTLLATHVTLDRTGTANGVVTVTGTGLTKRTIKVSSITGDGTLGISLAAGTASNVGGPSDAAGPSTTFAVANTLPRGTISEPSASSTRTHPVTYTITYTGATAVSLSTSKVTLVKTGTATGSISVSGAGTLSRTVTISSVRGDGTLAIKVASSSATNAAGSAPAFGPGTAFRVINSAPKVAIGAPSASVTKSGPVTFTLTYAGAEAITLSEANVTLNKTGTANGTVAVSADGMTTRTVTVSNITGDGTLGISVAAGTASNFAGSAPAAGPSAVFGVVNSPPAIAIGGPSAGSTRTGPVTYTVTYSGATAVTLTAANVTLIKTGTANGVVAVSGTGTATRTITVSKTTGEGTLAVYVAGGTASNAAGVADAAGPSASFTVTNSAPRLTISNPSMFLAYPGETVTYTVTYTGATTVSLTAAKITLNKTGTANGVVTVTGTGASTRTVTISGITGMGTLGISVLAGTATSAIGSAPAAGPSPTFRVDNPLPPPVPY